MPEPYPSVKPGRAGGKTRLRGAVAFAMLRAQRLQHRLRGARLVRIGIPQRDDAHIPRGGCSLAMCGRCRFCNCLDLRSWISISKACHGVRRSGTRAKAISKPVTQVDLAPVGRHGQLEGLHARAGAARRMDLGRVGRSKMAANQRGAGGRRWVHLRPLHEAIRGHRGDPHKTSNAHGQSPPPPPAGFKRPRLRPDHYSQRRPRASPDYAAKRFVFS